MGRPGAARHPLIWHLTWDNGDVPGIAPPIRGPPSRDRGRGDRSHARRGPLQAALPPGRGLERADAICRDLALKMPGATLPEVIAALPEAEQQSVRELYRTLADPVITPVGA